MTIISGKEKDQVVYIHDHSILVPGSQEVLAVIIGDCVYGKKGAFKGKFINKKLYSPEGEMLATEHGSINNTAIDLTAIRHQIWNVINSIKNHSSPWVVPKNIWAAYSFPEFLSS